MEEKNNENLRKMQGKSGFMTFILSMIPGVGHMYLGLMNKGLVLMAGFMFMSFFTGWLNIPFLGFILPVMWFYSVFDAMNIRKGSKLEEDLDFDNIIPNIGMNIDASKLGYGLIIIGGLILFEKILTPLIREYLTWQQRDMIKTLVVSGIFIFGGIKLIAMNRDEDMEDEDIIDEDEEEGRTDGRKD